MKKIAICLLLGIALIVLNPANVVYAEEPGAEIHTIKISAGDDGLSITESLTLQSTSNETYEVITFWIQSGAEEISILVNNNPVTCTPSGNDYICNISDLEIVMNTSMQVTISYTLGKDIEEFKKTLTYDAASLTVTFGDNLLYSAENLVAGGLFTLCLYEPTEAPLSWYIIVFIILLVILLVVSTLYSFRKQRSTTIKDIASESEELLKTKKALLMSLLKDIEKQHRAKQISDDTYHKLKEYYKQQAVEAMKKLEDIK